MTVSLFPDQQTLKNDVYGAWWTEGHQNVLMVSPTGSGKTIIIASIIFDHLAERRGASIVIAHHEDLLKNMSLALCKFDVQHQIIAPDKVVRHIVSAQMKSFKRRYHTTASTTYVASLDTIRSRKEKLRALFAQCTLWVQDEAHHIVRTNQFGKVIKLFPNAKKGLGVTATAERADGLGLGRDYAGVMDTMVVGEDSLTLIDMGRLCQYEVYAKESSVDISQVNITKSGEFSSSGLGQAYAGSEIIGDAVEHYKKWGQGGRMLAFTVSIDEAGKLAKRFNDNGIKAVALSHKSDIEYKHHVLGKLQKGEIKIVANVGLFGEGTDVPSLDGVIFVRHTASFTLFNQHAGRPLRVAPGKEKALILDCVGNVKRHAFTEVRNGKLVINLSRPFWTLAGTTKRAKAERKVLITECDNPTCGQPYPRELPACPWCGLSPEPMERSTPDQVDGDLSLLDPKELKKLTTEVLKAHTTRDDVFAWASRTKAVGLAAHIADKHEEKRKHVVALNDSIALWAGYQRYLKRSDAESYKRFFIDFGTDVLTAQTLSTKKLDELNDTIQRHITDLGQQVQHI